MNEELDDVAVTAAVAGYPRTGRDLADGYMLVALIIRATYDPTDPEIDRALRLYTGGPERLRDLAAGLHALERALRGAAREREARRARPVPVDANTRYRMTGELHYGGGLSADLADMALEQADTQVMPRVPGEVTQEIQRPIGPPAHLFLRGPDDRCAYLWTPDGARYLLERCDRPDVDSSHVHLG